MPRFFVTLGIIFLAAGLLWPFLRHLGFDRLPGDIVIEHENARLYFPIATSLVISIILSLILWLFHRR